MTVSMIFQVDENRAEKSTDTFSSFKPEEAEISGDFSSCGSKQRSH